MRNPDWQPMNPTAFTTVRDLLRHAVTQFNRAGLHFGHGSSDAMDEAAYLIDNVLSVISRRSQERVPAAYITHEAWLGEYRFYVDERVLVPRSFIAELIPDQFSPWVAEPGSVTDILELCTGSGCLAILLADAFPEAMVDAVDISADALDVARRNVDTYQMADRIDLVAADLYASTGCKQYDLIVTNPPYVNAMSMQRLPDEYRHEPQIALAGGSDGMDLVRRIVEGARSRLRPGGILVVEIGNERVHAEAAFPDLELTWLTTSAGDDMVFMLTAEQLAG